MPNFILCTLYFILYSVIYRSLHLVYHNFFSRRVLKCATFVEVKCCDENKRDVLSYVWVTVLDTKNRKSNTPASGKGCTESGRESIFRHRSVAGTLYTGWPRKTVHLHNSPRLREIGTRSFGPHEQHNVYPLLCHWRVLTALVFGNRLGRRSNCVPVNSICHFHCVTPTHLGYK